MKTIDELGISPTPWRTGHNDISVVCGELLDKTYDMVSFGRTPYNGISRAKYKANARLIASAPELYECLRKFYDLEFPMGYEGVGGEWLDLAKATEKALAKASGEEVK